MISLLDNEQIMRTYAKDLAKEKLIEHAKYMLKIGKLTIEEIPECYPELTSDNIEEINQNSIMEFQTEQGRREVNV